MYIFIAPRLLDELYTEDGSTEDLTIYDFVFWENMRREKLLEVFNKELINEFKYIPHTCYGLVNKRFMSFLKDDKVYKITFRWRDKFHWKWHEFVELVNNCLKDIKL